MRILHCLNHTYRQNGNVHAAIDLACAQAAAGHRVSVCSSGGSFDDLLSKHHVSVFHLNHDRRPLALLGAIGAFSRLCGTWKPDVVHAHMATSAVIAWLATRRHRIPLITTVHNEFQRSARLMGIGDRVVAVSRAVRERLLTRGFAPDRVRVVVNGTVGSARHPSPRPGPAALHHPAIVFVGGMHPRKGVADLIYGMRLVRDAEPDVCLYLVGEGPMQGEYEALTAELDLGSCVTFTGAVDDPRPYLLAADVFVLPSLSDPAPLVISEARDAGCAIVASNVGGIREMLDDGAAGVLVEPKRPDQIAAAILRFVQDEGALVQQKELSQLGVARLSVDRVAAETVRIYRDAIDDKTRRFSLPRRVATLVGGRPGPDARIDH